MIVHIIQVYFNYIGGACLDYYKIGQRIRKLRKAQELSQEQLAEQVGISTTHMSHIETGNTKLSLPVLVDLAEALHATTDELLFDTCISQKPFAIEEIRDILDGCSPAQARIISEIIKSAKIALDKYN